MESIKERYTAGRSFFARPTVAVLLLIPIGNLFPLQTAKAQCLPDWADGFGNPGMEDFVYSMVVFDDGTGPALFVGGAFADAGGVTAANIAKWDGSVWSPLGTGTSSTVYSLAVFDEDDTGPNPPALFAGGSFVTAGGTTVNQIARWNGSTWSALDIGMGSSAVFALTVFDDGTGPGLYAGGSFSNASGVFRTQYIAKWDGSAWFGVGNTEPNSNPSGLVRALTVFDDGGGEALYIGGQFTTVGSISNTVNRIAKWNGTDWTSLAAGVTDPGSAVEALAVFGGSLYVGGTFTDVDNGIAANRIARWSGTAWFTVGGGLSNEVDALTVFDDGSGEALFLGGTFTNAGGVAAADRIAKWNGSAFSALGAAGINSTVNVLSVFDDGTGPALYAGGLFTLAGGSTANYIARWREVCPPITAPSPHDIAKNRYISFAPNDQTTSVAFRVEHLGPEGVIGWVGVPDANGISRIVGSPVPLPEDTHVWSEPVIHVGSCEIGPQGDYEVRSTDDGGTTFSAPFSVDAVDTWGDVAPPFNPPSMSTQPDAIDIVNVSNIFQGISGALHFTRGDLDPQYPNGVVNFADVFWVGKAVLSVGYPFTATCSSCTCESNADCDDSLFCNGKERCIDCMCQSGAVPCDFGCNEGDDSCTVASTSIPIIGLVPLGASVPYTINGAEISIPPGGCFVKLELKVSKWDHDLNGSPRLGAAQAALDSSSLLGANANPPQPGINLSQHLVSCPSVDSTGDAACRSSFNVSDNVLCRPASELPGCGFTNCCQPSFQRPADAGWVLVGASTPLNAVRRSTADVAWGAAAAGGSGVADPGSVRHMGTLMLDVPPSAGIGTYTVTLKTDVLESFILDGTGDEMVGKRLDSARITIAAIGACCDDSTGDCTESLTQVSCEGGGDRYGGNGSTCASINPPCLPPPTLLYVNAAATGLNNGTSWTNAFTDLQNALSAAVPNTEIWVAKGTYKPTGPGGSRSATFQLANSVAIYGGFFGGESDRDLRDPVNNVTIASGDLNGDDVGFTNNAENSYHVMMGSGTDTSAVLDGVTVTGGNADGSDPNSHGGGMILLFNGSATIRRCVFTGNSAVDNGALAAYGSNALVTDCVFSGNRAAYSGGVSFIGGAPSIVNCHFDGNLATAVGGGAGNYGTSAHYINCTFSGNSAGWSGGILFYQSPAAKVTNCSFSNNIAGVDGGGIGVSDTASMLIQNSVFWNNADSGGMDESAQIDSGAGAPTVNYSIVQGTWTGAGSNNSAADPLFVDDDGADNVAGTADDDLRLQSGSPAIDAADTPALPADTYDLDGDGITAERISQDLGGNPRILDDINAPGSSVDMGAYEYFPDCDGGGVPDACDLDCGGEAFPCDIPGCGDAVDCNGNDVPDACEIAEATSFDCNLNGKPDLCDVPLSTGCPGGTCVSGCSNDLNEDCVPDECTTTTGTGGTADWSEPTNWPLGGAAGNFPDDGAGVADQHVTLEHSLVLNLSVEIDSLLINDAATLEVSGGDLLIVEEASQTAGIAPPPKLRRLTVGGKLYPANNRTVTVPTDALAILPGGVLQRSPATVAAPVESTAAVTAAEVVILGGSCEGAVSGGELTLDEAMSLTCTGSLIVDGSDSVCPPICSAAAQGQVAGITPPPKLRVKDRSRGRILGASLMLGTAQVEAVAGPVAPNGSLTLLGAVEVDVDSTEPLELGGDFDNQSVVPSMFHWTMGKMILDGTSPQVFEVAGINLGQTMDGFSNDEHTLSDTCPHSNYSMGSLEVAASTEVTFVNRFANTRATGCAEALYVNDLTFQSGATVTIDNCKVYYETLTDNGVVPTLIGCGEVLSVVAPIPPPPPSGPSSGRSIEVSLAPPSTGGPGPLTALRLRMIDLQHPVPANVAASVPKDFTAWDVRRNGVCSGGSHNGHHCDGDADCRVCATGNGAGLPCTSDSHCRRCTNDIDIVCSVNSDCVAVGGNCGIAGTCPATGGTCANLTGCADAAECSRWVGEPEQFWESQDSPGLGSFKAARLQCTPFYHDWTGEGLFYVVGAEIVPSSVYDVQQFSQSCQDNESTCTAVSQPPLRITTSRFGDAVPIFNPPSATQQPDVTDISQLVNKFKNLTGAPMKALAQMQPNTPELNGDLNVSDIVQCVDAVKSLAYPFSGPCPCPSLAACGQLECSSAATCTESMLPGLGSAALCVKTCTGGSKHGKPCLNNNPVHNHCPGGVCGSVLECASGDSAGQPCTADAQCPGSTCGVGFCRDRCGRCTP